TGVIFDEALILELLDLAKTCGAKLMVDETYRDLLFNRAAPPYAAALDPTIISVASLSKAFGVPGIRVGWIVCTDAVLMERFLTAKEQVIICGSVLDEAVALQVL